MCSELIFFYYFTMVNAVTLCIRYLNPGQGRSGDFFLNGHYTQNRGVMLSLQRIPDLDRRQVEKLIASGNLQDNSNPSGDFNFSLNWR